jgi:hypothetical protein
MSHSHFKKHGSINFLLFFIAQMSNNISNCFLPSIEEIVFYPDSWFRARVEKDVC